MLLRYGIGKQEELPSGQFDALLPATLRPGTETDNRTLGNTLCHRSGVKDMK